MSMVHQAETVEMNAADDIFAKHFGPSPPPVRVRFGALSHPGKVRENNEDHFMVIERRRSRSVLLTNLPQGFLRPADDTAYVMAVADGIGGHSFGELASMLALRSAWDQAPSAIKWTWIINDREIDDLRERVELVFRRMDKTLLERARREPKLAGMGTTLTGAYSVGPEAFISHVGDSRAYWFHQGNLTQVTHDHTLAQECLDAGMPVPSKSWRHKLTNCLGGHDQELRVEFHHLHLGDGDQLLLCSDGLTDMVPRAEIATVLSHNYHPQERVRILVELALAAGGKDNVTVVNAQYGMN